ncbi:MAG: AIPR family protein [Syntrophorhabdaceae bacterium]
MELNEFYDQMREEVEIFSVGRGPSAAFLIWFLENFFRLDIQDAIDSVCDQTNDKGIDGIYIDDDEEIAYLFQSKFSPNNNHDQGDNDIRNFIGARQWFIDEESIKLLLSSTASKDLKSVVEGSKISEKLQYKLMSVFVTNKVFNTHANEYIGVAENLETFDCNDLFNKYTYFADEENIFPVKELFLTNHSKIEYNLPDGTVAKVYPIKAKELIKLEGIQDRTLFYKNVRYGVGKTRVNKSISNTIEDPNEHNNFFLYHNGITVVCEELNEDLAHNKISLTNYAVINGCQSMLTFFENKNKLSNNLYVLVKVIKLNLASPMVKKITYFANNQNSISLRDLRSNDSVQKTLQAEFRELFNNTILYKRKRGESELGFTEIIEKDFAAQIIAAIYTASPHTTHSKQKLFGEEYTNIFSRRINAQKIYLGYLLYSIVEDNAALLNNENIRNYGLALFFFSHILYSILTHDDLGAEVAQDPTTFVTTQKNVLTQAIKRIWELMTPDINYDFEEYANEHGTFFDYKNLFKNKLFVQAMTGKIMAEYIRLTRRNATDSFSSIYNQFLENEKNQNIA